MFQRVPVGTCAPRHAAAALTLLCHISLRWHNAAPPTVRVFFGLNIYEHATEKNSFHRAQMIVFIWHPSGAHQYTHPHTITILSGALICKYPV